ncbi:MULTISPECIES: nucleotidyltransferase family protein [Nocardiopsidaceae]|uniref:NDP-sugar synthase n=1 Tax=Streptomonospora nanhaiensis TaxID=1323731 RepID=A0ABY6YNR2_9ACTN|nr:NDP-sugar synthase [Streptomonospora nanhaiensis]WAE74037.1 NDP-sugar synthase [Streptomonospora nanhaiensis]
MRLAGMVLAAGVGSRLAPFTDDIPKPLVPVLDRPLLGELLDQLAAAGAEEVFVNLHHQADRVASYLSTRACRVPVHHRVEPELTGPAGALTLFADTLAAYDAVLVVSGDIVSDGGFEDLAAACAGGEADLVFGVTRSRGARRFGVLELDGEGTVLSAVEKPDVPDEEEHWISAGAYCLDTGLVGVTADLLAGGMPGVDYARDLAPVLMAGGRRVSGHPLRGYWRDIGTPDSLLGANLDAVSGRIPRLLPEGSGAGGPGSGEPPVFVHPTAELGEDVVFRGPVVIGAGTRVGSGAGLSHTVLLPGAVVPPGALVHGGLIGARDRRDAGPLPEAGAG